MTSCWPTTARPTSVRSFASAAPMNSSSWGVDGHGGVRVGCQVNERCRRARAAARAGPVRGRRSPRGSGPAWRAADVQRLQQRRPCRACARARAKAASASTRSASSRSAQASTRVRATCVEGLAGGGVQRARVGAGDELAGAAHLLAHRAARPRRHGLARAEAHHQAPQRQRDGGERQQRRRARLVPHPAQQRLARLVLDDPDRAAGGEPAARPRRSARCRSAGCRGCRCTSAGDTPVTLPRPTGTRMRRSVPSHAGQHPGRRYAWSSARSRPERCSRGRRGPARTRAAAVAAVSSKSAQSPYGCAGRTGGHTGASAVAAPAGLLARGGHVRRRRPSSSSASERRGGAGRRRRRRATARVTRRSTNDSGTQRRSLATAALPAHARPGGRRARPRPSGGRRARGRCSTGSSRAAAWRRRGGSGSSDVRISSVAPAPSSSGAASSACRWRPGRARRRRPRPRPSACARPASRSAAGRERGDQGADRARRSSCRASAAGGAASRRWPKPVHSDSPIAVDSARPP